MAKIPDTSSSSAASESAERVKESAQQIWLAGLGAFAKAQQEGGKVFEALVQDGLDLQRKTQAAAQERLAEASQKFSAMAGGFSSRAGQQWDKLEGIFEDRVARALDRLGIPSQADLQALQDRVDALEAQLRKLSAKPAAAKRTAARPGARPAAKTTPQPAVKRPRAPR